MIDYSPPKANCTDCPRLVVFREKNQVAYPDFFNGAVPSFGCLDAALLVVGLAPGLKGANATGRPFTGDYAGEILYPTLQAHGLTSGQFDRHADDGFALLNVRVTNAVRCLPPENKPVGAEVKQCNGFLRDEILAMPKLKVILSLGGISHKAVISALGGKQSAYKFVHGAVHEVQDSGFRDQGSEKTAHNLQLTARNYLLLNSYHTSRYNMNTGRLTKQMFDEIIKQAKKLMG